MLGFVSERSERHNGNARRLDGSDHRLCNRYLLKWHGQSERHELRKFGVDVPLANLELDRWREFLQRELRGGFLGVISHGDRLKRAHHRQCDGYLYKRECRNEQHNMHVDWFVLLGRSNSELGCEFPAVFGYQRCCKLGEHHRGECVRHQYRIRRLSMQ